MEGYTLKQLKSFEFDQIQEMFDIAFRRVNTFVDSRTELVQGKEKRAGEELIQERTKKQKVVDDKKIVELKQLKEVNPDKEEVAIDAILLVVKSPGIVDWKIHKKGKKSYYQIIRADGKSQMRHFKPLSLDKLRSLDFNILFDQEYSEEEIAKTMSETMEQYMRKTRADYGSGVARPKTKNKDNFELKGQFLKELHTNTFSGLDHEDVNEHIEKVLEIVDLFHISNITIDEVMLRAFPMSLTGAASRWLRNEPTGLITTWDGLKTKILNKYCPPAHTTKKMEEINNFQQEHDEKLYQAWERFKELLMKCRQHYLTEMQEVILFYNGLGIPTQKFLTQEDKMEYEGNNVVRTLMNVPIFVGTFSVVTDFAILKNVDAYPYEGMGDIIVGKPFLREVGIKARRFEGMITLYKVDKSVNLDNSTSNILIPLDSWTSGLLVYKEPLSKLDTDNDNDKIDIEQPSGDMYVIPLPNDGPFQPKTAEGDAKPESQWTPDERRVSPEKWLTFSQGLRNANHTQTLNLVDIYGRFVYEDNLIYKRYSGTKKALITTPLNFEISTTFFSNNVIQDFQENFDDEVDERSSREYIRDLDVEYQERALLANSKHFIKRRNNFSVAEIFEWDEEEVSDDEEVTQVKVLMALTDDELTVGKSHAQNGEWVDITIRKILKAKLKPFPSCRHYGFNDQRPDDCRNYPKCEICRSYDHFTSRHNRVIHIKGGVLAESSQSNESSIGRHIMKPIWYLDSRCSRIMTDVKSYLHKYVEQPAPRRNDVYVLDMSSLTPNEACFFAKASESINWLWHKRLSHLNFKNINKLSKQNKVLGFPSLVYSKDKPCTSCEKWKQHRASFKTKQNFSIRKCLHLLHMDLFRPDRWSKDHHIELVNTIGNLGEGMLTRSMVVKLTAASASECLFVDFLSEIEPKMVSEALKHPGSIDATQEELNQFYKNKVLTLVPLPYGKVAIGSKWVFRNKKDKHGTTTKNKARLVAQGYSQEEGIDYDETFAPVAKMESIKIFLAFTTYMNFKVYQMDVKSAFLNDKLKEEVYIKQPRGFKSSEFPDYVCKHDKVLYGLKQAPKACSSVKTLVIPPNNLGPNLAGKPVNETSYRGMIGLLMYLTTTRLDIQFSIVLCSVAMSLAEAEYVAVAGCCTSILWMKSQISYYDIHYKMVPIFYANTSAIAISNNIVLHLRTKHIDIRYHFIKDHILKGDIELHFILTEYQLANIFAKPLDESTFTRLKAELGMLNID
uniref:Retrovirus-related Pol polyprotein from transposon TNT 1-94 n=1 Tax=Tanacetum cinerariifolium TaxID=118510 RepID=A0A6L2K413_TANCI|nr:retrovirus-related Pol polyprotein from transposon TNT 1-94 [Tanacetum cinerariifolium]